MSRRLPSFWRFVPVALTAVVAIAAVPADQSPQRPFTSRLDVNSRHISSDASVRYDYDIVYVRMPRRGDTQGTIWAEIAHPPIMEAGSDLMLLHPDGQEELLVEGGASGAIADPYVSFDGEWVYYSHIQGLVPGNVREPPRGGADIFKIHVATRKIVRLTKAQYTPNAVLDRPPEYAALNLGPCPLPGGRVAFVSNRLALRPPNHAFPTLQLFVMDDDGSNVENIGHLNLGMALHPTILVDGRILFSSLESQGLRTNIVWGLWSIHPDGSNWGPVLSALVTGGPAANAFHFQTQLSNGDIVAQSYYNLNNDGFGTYFKFPVQPPKGSPPFGPAFLGDPRNAPLRVGRYFDGNGRYTRLPFSPVGIESLTNFADDGDRPADPSVLNQRDAPAVGKVTHPSGAPDNHLLTVWSPGPVNHLQQRVPVPDGGIYLIRDGRPIDEPAQMLLIKNDPRFNEQWPRALVSYKRIYGVDEPQRLPEIANDGTLAALPEGSPFGLVGTASLYKRESYPGGRVPEGGVTAVFAGGRDATGYQGLDPFNSSQNDASLNWVNQGADAGRYSNDDIAAVRILAMEPTSDDGTPEHARFRSHANERLRILGEIPVRKFETGTQPIDPDGNPDTSFLAKIPADVAFTFQTLDKDGMLLNMAQTWHQLRPGEVRTTCGGCHAHSQRPTDFDKTAAARSSYELFDLTRRTPLLTSHEADQSGKKWDQAGQLGLRYDTRVKNVEYYRDIRPILQRSCVACHSAKSPTPAGNLVLDDDTLVPAGNWGSVPGTYYRLTRDHEARYGYKPIVSNGTWRWPNASRYIRMFQSRRSLLIWKIFGRRTDGWSNDDFPTETVPGNPDTLQLKGQPVLNSQENRNRADLDFTGSVMPPAGSVGQVLTVGGKPIRVEPLSQEDRLAFVRWIDLGSPIDLDYDPRQPNARGRGWMLDEYRPTLTMTLPVRGENESLARILIGAHDFYTGVDATKLRVTADFAIDGVRAGDNLAPRLKQLSPGVWEYRLATPVSNLGRGTLIVTATDKEGNVSRLERRFSIRSSTTARQDPSPQS